MEDMDIDMPAVRRDNGFCLRSCRYIWIDENARDCVGSCVVVPSHPRACVSHVLG